MKQSGGQRLFSFLTCRLATAGVVAALALIAASGAKADVVETFNLSGSLRSFSGSPAAFTGTVDLDFSNNFGSYTVQSLEISVQGRTVFTQTPSVNLAASANGVIQASNSTKDMLTLMFTTFNAGTWDGFNQGSITSGLLIFGGNSGLLFGADGVISRDLSDPAILTVNPPPVIDPPPLSGPPPLSDPPGPITSAAVPELSTWAMMLLGLAGLGLAGKRRRAIGFLAGRG